MVENIRGLPGVFGLVSPAAYRSQGSIESKTEEQRSSAFSSDNFAAGVRITISEEALAMLHAYKQQGNQNNSPQSNNQNTHQNQNSLQETSKTDDAENQKIGLDELTEEEKKEVEELQARDRQVRAHEQAHLAAAGNLALSGANFEYKTGPDGKRYAVAGEVEISMRDGKTPEETIRIAEQVQRAALAPADPSPQDRRVASEAASKAMKARMELLQETNQKLAQSAENINEEEQNNPLPDGENNLVIQTNPNTNPELSPTMTPAQSQSQAENTQVSNNTTDEPQAEITINAQKAANTIRGRQEMNKISRGERGIFMGLQFSTLSIQT